MLQALAYGVTRRAAMAPHKTCAQRAHGHAKAIGIAPEARRRYLTLRNWGTRFLAVRCLPFVAEAPEANLRLTKAAIAGRLLDYSLMGQARRDGFDSLFATKDPGGSPLPAVYPLSPLLAEQQAPATR